MRILFDQGTPVPIRSFLAGHTVRTAEEEGWDRLSNGELLKAAEDAGFEVLHTSDKNMQHQQNLPNFKIAVVVLGNSRWPVSRGRVQRFVSAVNHATPGSYTEVDIPGRSR